MSAAVKSRQTGIAAARVEAALSCDVAKRRAAVLALVAKGVTDPSMALDRLNAAGGSFALDEVRALMREAPTHRLTGEERARMKARLAAKAAGFCATVGCAGANVNANGKSDLRIAPEVTAMGDA